MNWNNLVSKETVSKILYQVKRDSILYNVFPKYENIFKAFEVCKYEDLKVVIIGQDPYPQKDIATGILFGNRKEQTNLSPSLKIVKEAMINYEIPHESITFDQTLESICKQGVLMINSSLTVRENLPGSHRLLWLPFMKEFLTNLSLYNSGIIYVLLGKEAQSLKPLINSNTNIILEDYHPAYYARKNLKMSSLLFKQIKDLVKQQYNYNLKFYE